MLSASQLESYDLCPRKWAWRYLDGIELPGNAAAEFGSEVHEQLELYYKHGKPIDLTRKSGELAMAMLPYGPALGTPGLEIEEWFYLEAWGHKFRGKQDLAFYGGVLDWKTTSSFTWAKTAEVLKRDIQGCLYAASSMLKSGLPFANLRWVYGQKSPVKAKPIDVRVTREDITPGLNRIRKLADEIRYVTGLGVSARNLPYNANACEAYGGCAFKDLCNLSPNERMQGIVMQDLEAQKAAFAQEMFQRQQQQGGAGMAINPPQGAMNMNGPPQGGFGPPPGQGGPPQGQQNYGPPQGHGGPPQGQQGYGSGQQPMNYGPPQGQGGPPPGNYGPPQGQGQQGYGPPQGQGGPPPGNYGPPQGQQGAPQGQGGPPQGEPPKRQRRSRTQAAPQQAQGPQDGGGDLLDELVDMIADRVAARLRGG